MGWLSFKKRQDFQPQGRNKERLEAYRKRGTGLNSLKSFCKTKEEKQ